jgi:hypothetical protein
VVAMVVMFCKSVGIVLSSLVSILGFRIDSIPSWISVEVLRIVICTVFSCVIYQFSAAVYDNKYVDEEGAGVADLAR